ncbi:pikachurin-like [Protopterus annectens]|uniref:pikachurin-like n=1 Tax=Protopterus annectens TaxID=7888 RepID=UPI001CFAF54D|nr:pikachurin-like [Protopterus annectens]
MGRTGREQSAQLGPPLDVQLHSINCTAIGARWKMPKQHAHVIIGYTVFFSEETTNKPMQYLSHDIPLHYDVTNLEAVIGGLKPGTQYRVHVGAYDSETKGQTSVPKSITTLSKDRCMPPAPPEQPQVVAVSDSEVALSWKRGSSEGSSPIKYYVMEYIRPVFDSSWTVIKEQILMDTMIIKGLDSDTSYQFRVRAANEHGLSPHSSISKPVRTMRTEELGSGHYEHAYVTDTKSGDDDGIDIDDSDYDIYIEEFRPLPALKGENKKYLVETKIIPTSVPEMPKKALTGFVTTTSTTTITPTTTTTKKTSTTRAHFDFSCEETACPADSFCIIDYDHGGARCHCSLGKGGAQCSEGNKAFYLNPVFH